MLKTHDPASVGAPNPAYSYGIEVAPSARWLHISGQVGMTEGKIGTGIEEQSEMVWTKLIAVLASANMTVKDLVKVTAYLTRAQDIAAYRAVRDKYLAGNRPASTLVVVTALANPGFVVEVEAVAAKG